MSDYEQLGAEIGRLVQEKQKAYGDSHGNAGKILEVLYPNGVQPEQYTDMLTMVRMIDKLFRVCNGNQGSENAWFDLVGYSLLGAVRSGFNCPSPT